MKLTHETIDAMTPDQLNEAVALRVMKWHRQETGPHRSRPGWYDDNGEHQKAVLAGGFSPATDANDALAVCEKLGIVFNLQLDNHGVWCASCYSRKAIVNKSFCIAICLAALHAVADMGGSDG